MVADLGVETIPFPPSADTQLAALRADTGLKMPDCCVLLAASQRHASGMTFDSRVRSAARARGPTVAD